MTINTLLMKYGGVVRLPTIRKIFMVSYKIVKISFRCCADKEYQRQEDRYSFLYDLFLLQSR